MQITWVPALSQNRPATRQPSNFIFKCVFKVFAYLSIALTRCASGPHSGKDHPPSHICWRGEICSPRGHTRSWWRCGRRCCGRTHLERLLLWFLAQAMCLSLCTDTTKQITFNKYNYHSKVRSSKKLNAIYNTM